MADHTAETGGSPACIVIIAPRHHGLALAWARQIWFVLGMVGLTPSNVSV